jgi:hypothetical protein
MPRNALAGSRLTREGAPAIPFSLFGRPGSVSRLVKILVSDGRCSTASMLIHHAGPQLGSVAGVRDWPGQSATAPSMRIPDCGESNPSFSRLWTTAAFRRPTALRYLKSASGPGENVWRKWPVLPNRNYPRHLANTSAVENALVACFDTTAAQLEYFAFTAIRRLEGWLRFLDLIWTLRVVPLGTALERSEASNQ